MSKIDCPPLIMILHDASTDCAALRNLLVEKNAIVETAPLDESGIKKLVYCNCDGLILLGEPTQKMLVLLRDMLGRRLLPESFPVFYNSGTKLLIANNHGLGSLNIINNFEPDNCLNIATQYQSKKTETGSYLGWATVALMFVLLFLGLKGAKVFLPAGELETQVEKLKVNDPSDIYLRLLGPTPKLKDRLVLFDNLSSHPDFYFLPLDLSMYLISRRNEIKNYLDRVDALLTIPATPKVTTIGEIEATLSKIAQLKDLFPKKWEITEAYVFLLNKEALNQQLYKELLAFYADFNKRTTSFNNLSVFPEKQKIKGFDWKSWQENVDTFLTDTWPDSSSVALATNIPEILEMRLADHGNREKIRTLQSVLRYLAIPGDIPLQDFLFQTDLPLKMFQQFEKELPNWRNDLIPSKFPQSQKEVLQTLAFDLNNQIIPLLRTRILSMLGEQKTWSSSKSKCLNDPMLSDLGLFIQPISLLASSVESKPVETLTSLLSKDAIQLKSKVVKIKLNEGLASLLTEKPVLNITVENTSGTTIMFSTKLILTQDKIVLQGADLGLDYDYKWFDKVKAELELKDGLKLVWEKPQFEMFGWSSLLVDSQLIGSSTSIEKLVPVTLIFEPALIAMPSLLIDSRK
ncbi:MAG: hypothetical protein DWH70_12860 [Planctomycetota bacterium]|nr:MAG: hypothetical protein DWH70_12860 [Planctomycetota bacterium]